MCELAVPPAPHQCHISAARTGPYQLQNMMRAAVWGAWCCVVCKMVCRRKSRLSGFATQARHICEGPNDIHRATTCIARGIENSACWRFQAHHANKHALLVVSRWSVDACCFAVTMCGLQGSVAESPMLLVATSHLWLAACTMVGPTVFRPRRGLRDGGGRAGTW
jgi:hypothetical protein